MKFWKSNWFWKLILGIGALPYGACLWYGLDAAINGSSILGGPASKGLEGFGLGVLVWTYLYWPSSLIGLMLIMVSVFALAYLKKR